MANRLIVFEDNTHRNFYPLTLSRAIFSLRCGVGTLWERIAARFPDYEVSLSCRPELADLIGLETGIKANHFDYQPGDRLVFVNGRLRLGDKLTKELLTSEKSRIFMYKKTTAAAVVTEPLKKNPAPETQFTGEEGAAALGVEAELIEAEFEFYEYLWDLVDLNGNEISIDFVDRIKASDLSRMLSEARIDSSARILSAENLYIAPDAEIAGGVVIDNREGPVYIDEGATIGPLSFVEGPCYIGKGSHIFRGNIRAGCSFGPQCRVGGEVETSIFQGYTNKYHDGFIGHAYLGSWVNLGAMTTNSDLKNNYGSISVSLNGDILDTGRIKIGSFIGDHTKTGIGTLLNTGISIGFSCNIYGGTLVTSREVPSFSWGDETGYAVYRIDKALEVARVVMERRGQVLTDAHDKLFHAIFEKTTRNR
jgi:UDP-N-acetylglucosamine diphosphorylase/glucosamine-1-phosphate N-acetyltransferase